MFLRTVFSISVLLLICVPCLCPAQSAPETPVSSSFQTKFYGFVKADLAYDDSQTYVGNIAFWTNRESGQSDNEFSFTLNQTRLGLSVTAPPWGSMSTKAVVEMDFYGRGGEENTPNLRMYRAFVELAGPGLTVLVGQDWDTHSSLYPTTLNFAYLSTAGNIMYRRPQLRLTKALVLGQSASLSLATALARTIAQDLDGLGKNDGDDAGWPTLEGRLAFEKKTSFGVPWMLAGSGHYGKEEIDWDSVGSDWKVPSWSVNGEIILPFSKSLYLRGEYFLGANLDAYYGGILQGINPTTRNAIKATGGWGELTFVPTSTIAFHAGAGVDHPFAQDLEDGNRAQNVCWYGNAYYNFTSVLVGGVEYAHYKTDYKNSGSGTNHRIQTSLLLSF